MPKKNPFNFKLPPGKRINRFVGMLDAEVPKRMERDQRRRKKDDKRQKEPRYDEQLFVEGRANAFFIRGFKETVANSTLKPEEKKELLDLAAKGKHPDPNAFVKAAGSPEKAIKRVSTMQGYVRNLMKTIRQEKLRSGPMSHSHEPYFYLAVDMQCHRLELDLTGLLVKLFDIRDGRQPK